jgi:hypothetical protein
LDRRAVLGVAGERRHGNVDQTAADDADGLRAIDQATLLEGRERALQGRPQEARVLRKALVAREALMAHDRATADRRRREQGCECHLPESLKLIAEEAPPRGRRREGESRGKDEVAGDPCVYIFVGLARGLVVKVGQTEQGSRRIVRDHLCGGRDSSTVKGWYERNDGDWPNCIIKDELVLLVFCFAHRDKTARLALERGLKRLLDPEIGRKRRRRMGRARGG